MSKFKIKNCFSLSFFADSYRSGWDLHVSTSKSILKTWSKKFRRKKAKRLNLDFRKITLFRFHWGMNKWEIGLKTKIYYYS